MDKELILGTPLANGLPPLSLLGEAKYQKSSGTKIVSHRLLMETTRNLDKFSVVIGKSLEGSVYFDLTTTPHLLIAGVSGIGKTTCLNTIICSLLMRLSPEELQLVLIDSKPIEFGMYEQLPHLAWPITKDTDGGIDTLKWCAKEMDRRYAILEEIGSKSLHSIPAPERPFPIMVIVIDELAELTLSAGVDELILELARKAKAVGMHLILSTLHSSLNSISKLIKENDIPGHIAFKNPEPELINLGLGEMLIKLPVNKEVVKCQGSFICDENIRLIVKWWMGKKLRNRSWSLNGGT